MQCYGVILNKYFPNCSNILNQVQVRVKNSVLLSSNLTPPKTCGTQVAPPLRSVRQKLSNYPGADCLVSFQREKKRTLFLYNDMLKKRKGFLRHTRHAVRRRARVRQLQVGRREMCFPKVNGSFFLSVYFLSILGSFLVLFMGICTSFALS